MKEGDYVRTKDGIIAKITDIIEDLSIDCDRDVFDLDNMAMMEIPWNFKNEYIIKSSSNIIDLIEIGDYVNGSYVEGFIEKNKFQNKLIITETGMIDNNDIKSIVTKEQFKSIEYEVK